jgi:hypothetical protein
MADSPNAYMPDVPMMEPETGVMGQPVSRAFGHTPAPTTPGAQAADPGTPPRFFQPDTMERIDPPMREGYPEDL